MLALPPRWPPPRKQRLVAHAAPHEVLGVAPDASPEAVRRAYRTALKRTHPDVNSAAGAAAATQALVDAARCMLEKPRTKASPFLEPQGEATVLFVNELACLGRACFSSCVTKAPAAFAWAADTGAARAVPSAPPPATLRAVSQLQAAVGQCPQSCIHELTSGQAAVLSQILQSAVDDRSACESVGVELAGLLARAEYENGRTAGRRHK
jgi:hypothetical protein